MTPFNRISLCLISLFMVGVCPATEKPGAMPRPPAQAVPKNVPSGITMANIKLTVKNPHADNPTFIFSDPFSPRAFGAHNVGVRVFPQVLETILKNKLKATATVTDEVSFNSVLNYLTLETYAHEWTHKNDYVANGLAFIKTNMVRNYPLTFKQANSTAGVPQNGFYGANSQAYRNCTAHAVEITAYLEGRAAVTMVALRARFLYDLQQSLNGRIAGWENRGSIIPGTRFLKFTDLFNENYTPKGLDDIITLAEQCVLADFGRARLSFGLHYSQAYRETVMPGTVHPFVKKDGKLIVGPIATMDGQFRIVVKTAPPEQVWEKIHGDLYRSLPSKKYDKSLADFTAAFKAMLKEHAPKNCAEYTLGIYQVTLPNGQETTEIMEATK